mgnify:CR=1 FL=1
MELKWLDDYIALIETGTFSAAAERRHVSQPAFSRRIQMLEEWLGVTLIDRSRKPLQFTPVAADNQAAFRNLVARIYEFRAALMVRNNEGLTKTYNRFHDPHETSPDILKLRELHAAMDRAVLEAYGWHDLAETATCEFLLDYEDEEEEDEQLTTAHGPRTSRRKKPWRYRWPDEFRDEVLARLLALNKERAEREQLAGKAGEAADGKKAGRKRLTGGRKSSKKNAAQRDLPGV